MEGIDAEAFSVSPERAAGSATVQVVVRNSELVDYEKKTVMEVQVWLAKTLWDSEAIAIRPPYCHLFFCLQVVATDSVSKESSVATVTIHLRDINDHRPTFSQSLYELTVPENSPTGFVVTDTIKVSDTGWAVLGGRC